VIVDPILDQGILLPQANPDCKEKIWDFSGTEKGTFLNAIKIIETGYRIIT
jgi:hypothetical protein